MAAAKIKKEYLDSRTPLINRCNAMHLYITNQQMPIDLPVNSRFAFFAAKDLVAVADMLNIVLERIQIEMTQLKTETEKQILAEKLKELAQTREEISACMRKQLETFDQNSAAQRNTDVDLSFMELAKPENVKHNIVYFHGVSDDYSLSDKTLTEHPMRETFDVANHAVFKPNEVFCIQYISNYGTDDDKQWLQRTNRNLEQYKTWYDLYVDAVHQLISCLPNRNSNSYVGAIADAGEFAYQYIQPLVKTVYDTICDWGKIAASYTGMNKVITELERNFFSNFELPQFIEQMQQKVTVAVNLAAAPLTYPEKVETPQVTIKIEEPFVVIPNEEEIEAEKKFQKFKNFFDGFDLLLNGYLNHIQQASYCNAFNKSKDGIDFIKNFFGRKHSEHRKIINNIKTKVDSYKSSFQDIKNFNAKFKKTREVLKP